MKALRKLITLALVSAVTLSMTACGDKKEDKEETTAATTVLADTETETETEAAALTSTDNAINKIKERGKLIVGAKFDVPKFGYDNPVTGKLEGMEIDLARDLAKEILGDPDAVEFVMVTAKTRGPLMDAGSIDVSIATMTTNAERLASYAHTEPYYVDIGAVMVMNNSGIDSFADLDGKTLGAPQGSSSLSDAKEKADEMNISLETAEFATVADCKAALVAGRVDAITNDTCILSGLLDSNSKLLPEKYHKQEYRIWTKMGNDSIIEVSQNMLDKMNESGELKKLFDTWGIEEYSGYQE